MNKQPIALISNDWHIDEDNIDSVISIIKQKCELAKKIKVKTLLFLGDAFVSRAKQPQIILNTFEEILDIIYSYKLDLYIVIGNHEKTDYKDSKSFLDSFQHHPCVKGFYSEYDNLDLIEGIRLHFIPFFADKEWLERFNPSMLKDGKNILCSHIAVVGSRNNDGSLVNNSISSKLFKDFDTVLLGHYHDYQCISNNIYHLPSIKQKDFGENTNKGFTILYNDCTHEIVRSDFKVFRKVIIDADKITKEELNEAIQTYQKQSKTENIRFVFEGSEDKLNSINKERFYQVGIDVQMNNRDIEIVEDFDTVEITQYDSENIVEEFEEFCETNSYDLKEGLSYLK